MKLRATFALFTALLLLVAGAWAADINGKWTAEMPGRDGNTRTVTFDLKADGDKLTGTMMGPMGRELPISDGTIHGNDISFNVVMEFNGNSRTMKYTGTLKGNELQMKQEGGQRTREFTAKRATT
jgi:hypothetical protein